MADKGTSEAARTEVVDMENGERESDCMETNDKAGTTDTEGGEVAANVALMRNPAVLAAIQDRLGGMVGLSGGYIESLPACVKRRIKALKKLQYQSTKIEAKFYEEVHLLECKYNVNYQQVFDKRRLILTGGVEPTDSDCDWPSDDEDCSIDQKEVGVGNVSSSTSTALVTVDGLTKNNMDDEIAVEKLPSVGIPYFWLTVFKNVEMLSDMVQEHDEIILKHLEDIKVSYCDSEPYAFTLHFLFAENEFFTNNELTKYYELRVQPDECDPFGYEGVEIVKCKGCTIDWNKGKNVTVKTVKKTQRHKGRGTKRTVTKQVQNDSFFNFFSPPAEAENEDDEDTEALLAADFEIGQFLRERIIPRAVLYFTGEALDEDDDEYDEEGEEDDGAEEEDGSEDETDPDFNPGTKNPQECKQQ